jgi:hypothetical protein
LNIRTATLSLAILASLGMTGCDKLPIPGLNKVAAASAGSTLVLDKETRGEITSSSAINYGDGSRSQTYQIKLDANQAVELKLGGALSGRLTVFKGNALVGAAGGSNDGMRTSGPVSLAFRSTEAGTYTVGVSGMAAESFGPFVLSAKPIVAYAGQPIAVGGEAIDWLMSETQDYKLKIDKAGLYSITAESAAFDTVLSINGNGVQDENDDGGNGTNSRLQLYLEPGEYTASVRGLGEGKGAFKLAVSASNLEEGTVVRDGTTLPANTRITGLVGNEGSRSFNFVLAERSRVTFDARSTDFDTVLEVSGNGVNAEDDDGGSRTDSRLELNLAPGTYTVDVRSLGSNPGSFTLQANVGNGNLNRSVSDAAAAAVEAAAAAVDAAAATAD